MVILRNRLLLSKVLCTVVFSVNLVLGGFCTPAFATDYDTQTKKHKRYHAHAVYTRPQPASFIVDADTGKVLESENPDSPRYPASLTKMMTLYLTFDALQKGKLAFDTMLPVSEYAASQPQTNIALKAGDSIAVKDAILSIVIRSANDSAVVLGEYLGGSESAFAQKMTTTAHALGMQRTVFRNANGLPDPDQHTTAHDMAVLGMALRKHFPAYFAFFKAESFTYHGKTYPTHNHVMVRYEGVDGIKTGYIRASGFNLVTSATRGTHHLIGVVMGGPTWRARDDKMIALLDRTFAQLAAKDGGKNTMQASASKPAAVAANSGNEDQPEEGEGDVAQEESSVNANTKNAGVWAIQVGAFSRHNDALNATKRAMGIAPDELHAASASIADDANVHRARLINLTQNQAEEACHKLQAQHIPCFPYKNI